MWKWACIRDQQSSPSPPPPSWMCSLLKSTHNLLGPSKLYADDLVVCETYNAALERELGMMWRHQFKRQGLRVSRTKTAYMPCNDCDNNSRNYEEIQLGDDKVKIVATFKYLGSIFDSNGGAESDINNRVKLAWMKWKQLTGVLCDTKVPIKLKDMVYKTVIMPTIIYGAECWAVRKKDENRLHVAEMKMIRWIRGEARKDHVRNQVIQENVKVCEMSTFLRQNVYGHTRRREEDNLSRKTMDMVVPGKRRKGRPIRRWIDNDREDMKKIWTDSWHDWKQDSTGKWWWRLAQKDAEMVSKCEKGENPVFVHCEKCFE